MALWIDNAYAPIWCGGDKNKSLRKMARRQNNMEMQNWYMRLLSDALDRYELEGLPDTCDQRVIKLALNYHAGCIFFDKDGSLLALPGYPTEDFNLYGNPGYGWVYGRNGFNEQVKLFIPGGDNSAMLNQGVTGKKIGGMYTGVYVRENYLTFPFANYVASYAYRLMDTFRSMDVIRKNLKQPYIVVAEESIINTVKQYFNSRDDNEEAIVSSGIFPADKINLLPFQTQADALHAMQELHEWYYNQFKILCGVNGNSQSDKNERLVVAEVTADDQATEMQIDKTLECLNEHLEQVNKCFGTHITAVKKHEKKTEGKQDDDIQRNSGENTGTV